MFFLRDSFPIPTDLAQALEAGIWAGAPSAEAIAKKSAGLRSLWPKLAKNRGIVEAGETHYSFRREEAEAYAAYYLPANALKMAVVLEEAFLLGHDLMPRGEAKWLDIGTGPGTAFWGAAWWSARRSKNLLFTGWDQSPLFTELASNFSRAKPFGFSARFESPSGKGEGWEALLRRNGATHLSFVNSLAEVYPEPARRLSAITQAISTMRQLSAKDGLPRYLIILEPGSRDSSRELAELKDQLQASGMGRVLFPCLDSRPCGALRDPRDWCHEEVRCEFPDWVNELGASVGLRKEALLFSYVVIAVNEAPLLPGTRSRIVSQRMERKGQVECRLCLAEGKFPARVQRSKATAENEFALESVRGEIWERVELGEKGDILSATLPSINPPNIFQE